jgi:biopolymer transport protein ExbB
MIMRGITSSFFLATASVALSQAPASPLLHAQAQAEQQLSAAERQLSALRQQMEKDTVPLSQLLNELEGKLVTTKSSFENVDRTLASKQLENTNLDSEAKRKKEENAYLGSIMDEFARGLEAKLFPGEAGRYKPIIEEAKLSVANPDMGQSDKFKRQIAVVKTALSRIQDLVGGARFPGKAVDAKGNLIDGTYAMIGPAAYFSSSYGDVSGLAVIQTSSPNPLIRTIPSAAETAEIHEKIGMWIDKLKGVGEEALNRPGITAMIQEGSGWMPLDASKGAALRDMVHKFNLIETFIHGGWIMWPILLASIAAFTVVIERVFFILNASRKRSARKLTEFFAKCERHDLDGAVAVSKTTKDFIVQALGYALEHRDTSLHSALIYSSQTAIKRFTRGLPVLDTVITLSPMLGLLGTVTGMMGSFQSISGSDGNPTAVMGGISEALIATAAGLGIALICVIPFNYLNTQVENAQKELDTAAARLELLIQVSEQVAEEKRKQMENKPPPPAAPSVTVATTALPAEQPSSGLEPQPA